MSGLYIHIPFCRRKCPYCDFFSVSGAVPAEYVQLLCRHLELAAACGNLRGPFRSIFFGGGTPSLLAPAQVARVLERAAALFGIDSAAEISLEANPGTVTEKSLRGYRSAGINRISLGVQSLNDGQLARLGRIHSAREARLACSLARRAGFDNLSLDMMFALPGQHADELRSELQAYLELSPEHLSCYGLTVEEGTPFSHRHRAGGLTLPDEEAYAELFLLLHRELEAAGYLHYEIANYALPGRVCHHNLNYWRRGEYLGIGAGAHGFLAAGWGARHAVAADLDEYRRRLLSGENPAELIESFGPDGALAETVYLGLRTAEGVTDSDLRARFGVGLEEAFSRAVRRCGEKLLRTDGRWRFSVEGWLVYDHLISDFLG